MNRLGLAPMATSRDDEPVPTRPGRWTMYAIISLQGLPHCEFHVTFAKSTSRAHLQVNRYGTQGPYGQGCRRGFPSWFAS
eukprot:COSAG02_NODE_98_length_37150_cov_39.614207_10_plen_80_part_00